MALRTPTGEVSGTLVAQTSLGAVRFEPDDGGPGMVLDLEREEFRWLTRGVPSG